MTWRGGIIPKTDSIKNLQLYNDKLLQDLDKEIAVAKQNGHLFKLHPLPEGYNVEDEYRKYTDKFKQLIDAQKLNMIFGKVDMQTKLFDKFVKYDNLMKYHHAIQYDGYVIDNIEVQ